MCHRGEGLVWGQWRLTLLANTDAWLISISTPIPLGFCRQVIVWLSSKLTAGSATLYTSLQP
mgnify:FL=1